MKSKLTIILLWGVLCATAINSHQSIAANPDSTHQAYANKMDEMFAGVDLSLMPSGLLNEYKIPTKTVKKPYIIIKKITLVFLKKLNKIQTKVLTYNNIH